MVDHVYDPSHPFSQNYQSRLAEEPLSHSVTTPNGRRVLFFPKRRVVEPNKTPDHSLSRISEMVMTFGKYPDLLVSDMCLVFHTSANILRAKSWQNPLPPLWEPAVYLLSQDRVLVVDVAKELKIQGLKSSIDDLLLALGGISYVDLAFLLGLEPRIVNLWRIRGKTLGHHLKRPALTLLKLLEMSPGRTTRLLLLNMNPGSLEGEELAQFKRLKEAFP